MTNAPATPHRRYFAWRAAHLHESQQFQVLVGRRWLQVGSSGLLAFLIVLTLVPGRRTRTLAGVLSAALASGLLMLGSGVERALSAAQARRFAGL